MEKAEVEWYEALFDIGDERTCVMNPARLPAREETMRFIAFHSHRRLAAEFCIPGEGREKGGVEGEGGYFRRNHLVPVPSSGADLMR
jgi:hypothetical protein